MEYSNMKRLLSIVLFTMIFANPTLAQNAPTTTSGGGPDLSVQSTKGSGTLKDTTSHTTHSNGVVVSTSTGSDGKPNGGSGSGGGGTKSETTGVSREGE
jgi:hypothetical protein